MTERHPLLVAAVLVLVLVLIGIALGRGIGTLGARVVTDLLDHVVAAP